MQPAKCVLPRHPSAVGTSPADRVLLLAVLVGLVGCSAGQGGAVAPTVAGSGSGGEQCLPKSASSKDDGYVDAFRGWYDVQGCGRCYDFCRWVGDSGSGGDPAQKLESGESWWSCRLAGSPDSYSPRGLFVSWSFRKCAGEGAESQVAWRVLGTRHAQDIGGATGRYFNFDWADMEAVLGSMESGTALIVSQWRGGTQIWNGDVRVWHETNGGSTGDSHGRREPFSDREYDQWEVGDIIRNDATRTSSTTSATSLRRTMTSSTSLSTTTSVTSTSATSTTTPVLVVSNLTECALSIDGGGWTLVRHTKGSGGWGSWDDNLAGIATEGTPGTASSEHDWTVTWDSTSVKEFLFTFGDCSHWLIAEPEQVIGEFYENGDRWIVKSSVNTDKHQAKWYNRLQYVEDPWVSTLDHHSSLDSGTGAMLYGEAGNTWHVAKKNAHGGSNVYVRSSAPSGPLAGILQSTAWRLRLLSFNVAFSDSFHWVVCEMEFYSDQACTQVLSRTDPFPMSHGGTMPTGAFDGDVGTWSASECGSTSAASCNATNAIMGLRFSAEESVRCLRILHFGDGSASSECSSNNYGWDTRGTTRADEAALEAYVDGRWQRQQVCTGLASVAWVSCQVVTTTLTSSFSTTLERATLTSSSSTYSATSTTATSTLTSSTTPTTSTSTSIPSDSFSTPENSTDDATTSSACEAFGLQWDEAGCIMFEVSTCNGVTLPGVREECGSNGCRVLVDVGAGTCANYCEAQGLLCAGAWRGSEDLCETKQPLECTSQAGSLDSGLICECGGFKPQPSAAVPATSVEEAKVCLRILDDYVQCAADVGIDTDYEGYIRLLRDRITSAIPGSVCTRVSAKKAERLRAVPCQLR